MAYGIREVDLTRIRNFRSTHRTTFSLDKNNPRRCTRTINSRQSILQHCHALDFRWTEHIKGIHRRLALCIDLHYIIDYDKRLVKIGSLVKTHRLTYSKWTGRARTAISLVYIQTYYLSGKSVYQRRTRRVRNLIHLHIWCRTSKVLHALRTITYHDDFLQQLSILTKNNLQCSSWRSCYHLSNITDKRDFNLSTFRSINREITVKIRNSTDSSTNNFDIRTNYRNALFIQHCAFHCLILLDNVYLRCMNSSYGSTGRNRE